jgi:hypothetical protein
MLAARSFSTHARWRARVKRGVLQVEGVTVARSASGPSISYTLTPKMCAAYRSSARTEAVRWPKGRAGGNGAELRVFSARGAQYLAVSLCPILSAHSL